MSYEMLSAHHAAQHCPTIKIVLILVYFVVPLKVKRKKINKAKHGLSAFSR